MGPSIGSVDGLLIDRTALSLLSRRRADPAAHAAERIADGAERDPGSGTRYVFGGVYEEAMAVPMGGIGMVTLDGRTLTMPGSLPETAMKALAGRPLADLVELTTDFSGRVIEDVECHPTGVGAWLSITLTREEVPLPCSRI